MCYNTEQRKIMNNIKVSLLGSGSKGNGLHPKYATTSGYTDLPFKWIAIGPA